jgi:hypothetical protein
MRLSSKQKRAVRERAGECCEYCRLAQTASFARFHVDHIIAIKHGGTDGDDNLCLACPDCNAHKGENVAAFDPTTGSLTALYHPRKQSWDDHFRLQSGAKIIGLTPEGRATILVLRLNDEERVKQRLDEQAAGNYPCDGR